MKVQCSFCGRIVKGYIPKGGDGTLHVPYKHKEKVAGQIMRNDWCRGRFRKAEIWKRQQNE